MPQNDQDKQQSKVDRRHHKEIHCAYIGHMIAQEHLPILARPRPTIGHVLATVDCATSKGEANTSSNKPRNEPIPDITRSYSGLARG